MISVPHQPAWAGAESKQVWRLRGKAPGESGGRTSRLHGQEQNASVEAEGEGTRGEQRHGKSRGSTTRVQTAHRTPARWHSDKM